MTEGTQDFPAALDRGSILIVDDLPAQLLVLQTILADLGQDLVLARSGREALREVLRREFAVILLDVNMPDIDGFETAALIRSYKRSAHTPIIFVTAYADEMQTVRGYSLGAVDYILTPVVPDILRTKVKVFVELHSMQRQLRRQSNERIALAAAEAARVAAEKNIARSNFLSNASRVLSASLDIEIGRRRLLELVVPQFAVSAALLLRSGDLGDVSVSCCELQAEQRVFSECALEHLPSSTREALSAAVRDRAAVPDAATTAAGSRSIALPLTIGERSLGALWVRLTARGEDEALLQELASHAALAFENARLYQSLQVEVAERQQAQALLQDANQRKDEFLAMLSHELRNPLAPIRNAAEVIRLSAPRDSKIGWATDVTERQVDHLTRLIDELLDVSRISQGKIVLQTRPLDLLEVIAQSVETIRSIIDARRHQLTMSLPQGPLCLRGDFARLSQVVSNLLHNAAKYTDEGGKIHLSVTVDNGEATVAVRDNGIGIEPGLLAKVFDLFEQGDRSLDRSQGGLGVGLTLAQRLVQLHNGRIDAISAGAGLGSEFRVVLPCLTEVKPVKASEDRVDAAASESGFCRVLVVDDNLDAAQTITVFLELAGHEVKAVTDGIQALACAAESRPDVLVLDIGLPGIDGFQLARRLRDAEQTKNALLIGVTGYGQESDRQRAVEAGFDHYLVKPASPSDLARLIADWRVSAGRNSLAVAN
ncbi:MAG TPA: response regulator [Burkholderiaceae bacterium]|nr:response regulator [Burkholderiaceae bacterium]